MGRFGICPSQQCIQRLGQPYRSTARLRLFLFIFKRSLPFSRFSAAAFRRPVLQMFLYEGNSSRKTRSALSAWRLKRMRIIACPPRNDSSEMPAPLRPKDVSCREGLEEAMRKKTATPGDSEERKAQRIQRHPQPEITRRHVPARRDAAGDLDPAGVSSGHGLLIKPQLEAILADASVEESGALFFSRASSWARSCS